MSTAAPTVSARCVHCAWRTDQVEPEALREVRDIHELIHPGGTVLVGDEKPKAVRTAHLRSGPQTPLERIQAMPARPTGERTCEEVAGCTNPVIASRGVYARVCREHKDRVTERRRREGLSVGNRKGTGAGKTGPAEGGGGQAAGRRAARPAARPQDAGHVGGAGTSLVELAQAVEDARERRREAATALRAAGEEFFRAIAALSVALEAVETEEAA